MFADLKHAVALVVGRYAPSLLYYAADADARRSVRIRVAAEHIDIMRYSGDVLRIGRDHAIYLVDLIEGFDYYFSSVAPKNSVPVAGGRLVDFSTPGYHAVTGFDDFPILFSGLSEPMVTASQYLDFARLRKGDVAIDLGSYSALTSIVFARAVGPSGRVIALEPDPASYATARTNVDAYERATGLKTIELVQAAASGAMGRLRLSSEGTLGSAAASLVGRHRGVVVEVEAVTLDALAERHGLTNVDFIKIDIEGSEEELIASSAAFLKRFQPRLIIEPHYVRGVASDAAVTRLLTSYGYRCEYVPQIGVDALPLIAATPVSQEVREAEER